MNTTTQTIDQLMENLADKIRTAPEEKSEEIRIFLEGYLAGLERVLGQREAN